MKIKTVVELNVLDKVAKDYDMPVRDANGNETGRNKGTTYSITVKPENDVCQNIKLSKDMGLKFDEIQVGAINKFIFEFESSPKCYVDKKDGSAKINFADVPQIVDIIPFKK